MSGAANLLELQAADDRLTTLRGEASAVEARLARDAVLERLRAAAEEAAASERSAAEAVREREEAAESLRRRAVGLERRLYGGSVGNPQELIAMQHELEGLKARLAEAEDGLLAAMETAEQSEREARRAGEEASGRERARAAAAGPDAARLERLREELREVSAEREEVASRLEERELSLYRRLAGRLRPAVARLEGDACGGCRLPLGIGEVRRVRRGDELVQCPSCDRILIG